jgi:hypothetical protein
MSYMADRDHIAITTGDTSTTRSKVFVAACPVVRLMRVTLRDSSDTYSRIVVESEKVARSRRRPPGDGNQQANRTPGCPPAAPVIGCAASAGRPDTRPGVSGHRANQVPLYGYEGWHALPSRRWSGRRVGLLCGQAGEREAVSSGLIGPEECSRGSSQWGAAEPRPSR